MPTPTTLTVNDRAATPVAHDFRPDMLDPNGVQSFVNTDGVKIGDKKITVSLRKTGSKYKIRLVVTVPTVVNETINGITLPKVIRVAFADLAFTFDESSELQERKDTVGFAMGLLSESQTEINAVLTDLENWW